MDLLDRLLAHDSWTTRLLIRRCHELSDEELDRTVDIGHRTVRETLRHIIFNVDVWTRLMDRQSVSAEQLPNAIAPLAACFEKASVLLARVAHDISARGAWDEEWIDILDSPPAQKTYGSGIAHILTDSMHHRAQLLYMLRRLGIDEVPEGDVFSWEREPTRTSWP
jgi:uncharacterized damage-inducible protein DinB